MPDVPKIVPHRLRNASVQDALAATHPEADALTAFIEQALSPPEREGVLQHLALCADCREAVVLALPALDAAVLPAAVSPAEEHAEVAFARSSGAELQGREDRKQEREENKSRFGWPSFAWTPLRWATLAAGIAVAVLVVRPALERMNEKPNASINSAQNHAAAPAGPPAADSQIASDVPRENPVAEGASKTLEQGPVNGLASGKDKATVNSSRSLMKPAVPPSDPEMHLAGNLARVPAGKSSGQSRSSGSRSNDGSRSDTVHVVAGGSLNEPSPDSNTIAQNDAQNGEVMVQSAPAVVKSKPPLDDTGRNTAAFPPVRKQSTTWTITQGVLQRSVDGGQTWQAAARAEHPLLCYASRGQEMWAGGEAGTLLRSSDNGATWNAVAVSYQGRSLDSAVTHIDVRGPAERGAAEVVVSTGDHQTWSSADGGKTWEKK